MTPTHLSSSLVKSLNPDSLLSHQVMIMFTSFSVRGVFKVNQCVYIHPCAVSFLFCCVRESIHHCTLLLAEEMQDASVCVALSHTHTPPCTHTHTHTHQYLWCQMKSDWHPSHSTWHPSVPLAFSLSDWDPPSASQFTQLPSGWPPPS